MFDTCVAAKVATLTMKAPPVNALSHAWLAGLGQAIDQLEARADWQVLIIRSDLKVFCAGADLNEMAARFEASDGPDLTYAYVASIQRLYDRIEALSQVTIAELAGAALGGGLELALACDLRIAADEAKLGLPEVRLGLIPGAGGSQRLTRLLGRGPAFRLILGAEVIDGVEAEAIGLVQWRRPRSEIRQKTAEIAEGIAALPASALAAAKRCVRAAADPGRSGYSDELEATRSLQTDPETRARVAAFLAGGRA